MKPSYASTTSNNIFIILCVCVRVSVYVSMRACGRAYVCAHVRECSYTLILAVVLAEYVHVCMCPCMHVGVHLLHVCECSYTYVYTMLYYNLFFGSRLSFS